MGPVLKDVLSCEKYRHENNSLIEHIVTPRIVPLFWLRKILEDFLGELVAEAGDLNCRTDIHSANCA